RSGEKSRLQWDPQASAQLEAANGTALDSRPPEPVVAAETPINRPGSGSAPLRHQQPSPELESFRLVTRRGGAGRLELPITLDQDDLRGLQAQIEAVFALVRARLGAPDQG